MPFKCPKCGSTDVIPIVYGLPPHNLITPKVYLAGCCKPSNPPQYHCRGCGKNVGSPPYDFSKRGLEEYQEVVTSIRFSDGGYSCGYPELMMKKANGCVILDVRPGWAAPNTKGLQRQMTAHEWSAVLHILYEKLFLHEWKKRYMNPYILDGEQWELEISLTGRRKRTYFGSNSFPPFWPQLKDVFRPYFEEANIILCNSDVDSQEEGGSCD